MIRRIPIIPTLIVLVAVAVMVRLGFWQIDRLHQKEALLARYAAAQALNSEAAWPKRPEAIDAAAYRRTTLDCRDVTNPWAKAGHNADGQTGWAHLATCQMADGGFATVVLGWSRDPADVNWSGGIAQGTIVSGHKGEVHLVASPPLAGLQANARPDPRDIPNNHFAYAVQWFLFAATALVIYALALRKRLNQ